MSQNAKISSSTFAVENDITQIDGLAGFKTGNPTNSNVKISGNQLITSLHANMDLNSISGGPLTIANGGTGQNNAQDAIDALTNASSSTSEYVLTSDGSSANWEAIPSQMTAVNKMTATSFGVAKIYDNVQPLASDTEQISTDANRTYGVQLNSDDQLVVNVPWRDTDVGPVESVTLGTSGASTGSALAISPNTGTGAVVITANSFNGGSNVGYVPDASTAPTDSFLKEDGSWEVPTNNTYSLSTPQASQSQIILAKDGVNQNTITVQGSSGITVTSPSTNTINIAAPPKSTENDSIQVLLDSNTNLANSQNDTTYVVPYLSEVLNTNTSIFSFQGNTTAIPNNWNAYISTNTQAVYMVQAGYHSYDGQNTNAQMDLWIEFGSGTPSQLGQISWPTAQPNLVNIGSGFVSTTLNGNAGQVGSCIVNALALEGPIWFRALFRHSAFTGGTGYPVSSGISVGGQTLSGYVPFLNVTLLK